MARNVKNSARAGRDRTRISSKHQVTIPKPAFAAAGFAPGDTVRVEATGPGQVTLTRLDELLDRYEGALSGGENLSAVVQRLRDEWE
jgi:bifunctional DNA-binding transcriptional regulator/antitoxin component of YhaV-PrlF toxin-antitoxin module